MAVIWPAKCRRFPTQVTRSPALRRGDAFGSPLQAVTGVKRRELVTAARVWVDRHGRPSDIYRFDCITLVDNKLEHIADAFRPGWR